MKYRILTSPQKILWSFQSFEFSRRQPLFWFLSPEVNFLCFWNSFERNHTLFTLLCLASQVFFLQTHPCCYVHQIFILFYFCSIPLCEYVTICLSNLIDIWIISSFWILWTELPWILRCKSFWGHKYLWLRFFG